MSGALRLSLLLPLIAIGACACATSSGPAASGNGMDVAQDALASANPRLSAEEIGEKFMGLISEMKSQDDLSLERVRDATGISLLASADGRYFGFSQPLGDDWFYALWYYPGSPGRKKRVRLDFQKGSDRFADMRAVCSMNFESFHRALKALGYRDVSIDGEFGRPLEWRYYKDEIAISIIPEFKIDPKDGAVFPTCVNTIGTLG